jgi:hypothetical protein
LATTFVGVANDTAIGEQVLMLVAGDVVVRVAMGVIVVIVPVRHRGAVGQHVCVFPALALDGDRRPVCAATCPTHHATSSSVTRISSPPVTRS